MTRTTLTQLPGTYLEFDDLPSGQSRLLMTTHERGRVEIRFQPDAEAEAYDNRGFRRLSAHAISLSIAVSTLLAVAYVLANGL